MNITEQLRGRFREEWRQRRDLAGLGTMLDNALKCIGVTDAKRAELAKSGTLTPRGVNDAVRRDLATGVVPMLRNIRKTVADRRATLDREREALGKPPVDKTDLHALMMRQERRAYLRSLSHGERFRVATQNPADDLVVAILEAPDMSGLDKERIDYIRERYIEAAHGARAELLDDTAEALTVLDAAVTVAIDDIRRRVDFDTAEGFKTFETWFDKAA